MVDGGNASSCRSVAVAAVPGGSGTAPGRRCSSGKHRSHLVPGPPHTLGTPWRAWRRWAGQGGFLSCTRRVPGTRWHPANSPRQLGPRPPASCYTTLQPRAQAGAGRKEPGGAPRAQRRRRRQMPRAGSSTQRAHPEKWSSWSWVTARGWPAAMRSMCSTRSCPVMASVMGCSTWGGGSGRGGGQLRVLATGGVGGAVWHCCAHACACTCGSRWRAGGSRLSSTSLMAARAAMAMRHAAGWLGWPSPHTLAHLQARVHLQEEELALRVG